MVRVALALGSQRLRGFSGSGVQNQGPLETLRAATAEHGFLQSRRAEDSGDANEAQGCKVLGIFPSKLRYIGRKGKGGDKLSAPASIVAESDYLYK